MEKSQDRLDILKKIEEYEKNGWFDVDVENDPPTVPLDYKKVDYTYSKTSTKIKTKIANSIAHRYFEDLIAKRKLIIKEVCGIENYRSVSGGAFITCNHFNAFDNYAVYKAIEKDLGKHDLYKVIREGNYTSFKGIYGYFFRHCNTLPLCSTPKGLQAFSSAISTLLSRGEKILIYPEQAMWWNYRKPRPLKSGAFHLAARNNAPIIPFFITMEDSDIIGDDGFPIQAYTINIAPPIYPDASVSSRENSKKMADMNYETWKDIYEKFYGEKLCYQEV